MEWTAEKDAELIERYPDESNKSLARDLGCSPWQLSRRAKKLGVCKAPDFMRRKGAGGAKKRWDGSYEVPVWRFRHVDWPRWLLPPIPYFRNRSPRAMHFCLDDHFCRDE